MSSSEFVPGNTGIITFGDRVSIFTLSGAAPPETISPFGHRMSGLRSFAAADGWMASTLPPPDS